MVSACPVAAVVGVVFWSWFVFVFGGDGLVAALRSAGQGAAGVRGRAGGGQGTAGRLGGGFDCPGGALSHVLYSAALVFAATNR